MPFASICERGLYCVTMVIETDVVPVLFVIAYQYAMTSLFQTMWNRSDMCDFLNIFYQTFKLFIADVRRTSLVFVL